MRIATTTASAILLLALLTGSAALRMAIQAGMLRASGSTSGLVLVRPGYALDATGGVLADVTRGGPVWNAGMRPGWAVDPGFPEAIDERGAISACGAGTCRIYTDGYGNSVLADQGLFDALAVAVAILGIALLRRRAAAAGLLGFAALALSAPTYASAGEAPLFAVLYLTPLIGPSIWLTAIDRRWLWGSSLAIGVGLGTAWTAAWLGVPGAYDGLESARVWMTALTLAAGLLVHQGWMALLRDSPARDQRLDAIVSAAIVASALTLRWFGPVSDTLAASSAAILVISYFALRHRNRGLFNRVLFAERRQRATLGALEAERSRLARDLHDVPLQEVSAIIRHLEARDDLESEVERLREVARHLRSVSVSLRPPVLDDVGLGAALVELLTRPSSEDGPLVELRLDDKTGIEPSTRPPADVELAIYRIVQEAVTNARRHANASNVVVTGLVDRQHVTLTVSDDGSGMVERRATRGERADNLGISSMRERAEAIGATMTIDGERDGGTVVTVSWSEHG